jgi:hypothetical protein
MGPLLITKKSMSLGVNWDPPSFSVYTARGKEPATMPPRSFSVARKRFTSFGRPVNLRKKAKKSPLPFPTRKGATNVAFGAPII